MNLEKYMKKITSECFRARHLIFKIVHLNKIYLYWYFFFKSTYMHKSKQKLHHFNKLGPKKQNVYYFSKLVTSS